MDDIVSSYIDNTYTPEMALIVYRALGLFNVFNLAAPIVSIVDAIHMSQEQHPEAIMDTITIALGDGLDQLFFAHRVVTSENASLTDKVNLMEAIYGFQYQESYGPLKAIMENANVSPRDRFIDVLSVVSSIDSASLEDLIDEVYEGTVDRMKVFLDSKIGEEEEAVDFELLKKVRTNLMVYSKAFGKPKISVVLEEFEFQYGLPFDTYFNLVKNDIINLEDFETTTFGLLWLALISEDGMDNPQKLLGEKIDSFFTNVLEVNRFNAMLSKALGRFQDFKGNLQ